MKLACLLTWLESGTSSGPTAGGVCSVNAWCLRTVDTVFVVADQEHSNCAIPQYRYRTELVWRL